MIYLSLHCHHQNNSCITTMGSDESHFQCFINNFCEWQSHKTISTVYNLFEEKEEPKQYQSRSFCQNGSHTRSRLLLCCGAGIAQWLERRTRDWKVVGSNPCWSGGRIFFSKVDFLCWLLFRYPFHPRVTAVTRKRSQSFCQKCRWQVTAKHAYTLGMWLCMKWHGAWLYGVPRM